MKKLKLFLPIIGLAILLSGCSKWIDRGESITAVGSSALQPLVETVAETYQTENPGKFINVQGGGSGTGLSQVQSGAVDIGNSDLFAEEKSGIDASALVDHRVAVVGITPIVNKDIGVKDISMENLKKLFTGEIKNWSEVGGKDQPVVILNGETAVQAQEQDSSGMVRQIVADTPGAISYVAFSYVSDDVDTLNVNGVEPTDENVTTNKWTIWAYEHMYTRDHPKKLTKEFLDYILSDEVQDNIVGELGYIPVSHMKVERDWQGNIVKE